MSVLCCSGPDEIYTHPTIFSSVTIVGRLRVISRESPCDDHQATLSSNHDQSCIRHRGQHVNLLNLPFYITESEVLFQGRFITDLSVTDVCWSGFLFYLFTHGS